MLGGSRDVLEIGLQFGIFAVAHRVVAAAGAVQLVRNHERQRRLLAAVYLPTMIEDMHAYIGGYP